MADSTVTNVIDNSRFKYTQQVKTANNEMGKDQFLKLLMAQLQNQDPMEPSDNTQMIAQMAQFSSLEAINNLTTSFSQTQAYSMIGKGIIGTMRDPVTGITSEIGGKVDSAGIRDGKAYVMVGDALVWAENIGQVFDNNAVTGDVNSIMAGTNMVGKYVRAETGAGADKTIAEGIVTKMMIRSGNLFVQVGDKEILLSQIQEVSNEPFSAEGVPAPTVAEPPVTETPAAIDEGSAD